MKKMFGCESEEEYLRAKGGSFELLIPKPNIVAALLIIIALVSTLALYTTYTKYREVAALYSKQGIGSIKACTMEAKLCSDGSAVGRTGPNCEFASCPISAPNGAPAGWKTYRNDQYGFKVVYPPDWKLTDVSTINSGRQYPIIRIESPLQLDLPGYENIPASYRILISTENGVPSKIQSIADFGSPKLSQQSAWNIYLDKKIKESTSEYAIGQQIIQSFIFSD